MSKAFTSEETPDEAVLGRAPERAARGQERPITAAGEARLRDRFETARAARAALGASAEPSERQRLDHEVAVAAALLESVKVVAAVADGCARFGAWVTVKWGSGRTQTVQLVGVDEQDTRAGRISIESPLARALIGARVGDSVEIERPTSLEIGQVTGVELRD